MELPTVWEKDPIELAWWVEIVTTHPDCIYYFGPFSSQEEAALYSPGYQEDLQAEGADKIEVQIKFCQPIELTICHEPFF